jgi:hypothetical protein
MSQQTPIAKFRAGQVSAALWENEIQTGGRTAVILKATIQRRYRAADGNWKSSTSFSRNEIPLAIHCLQKAFEKIIELQNESSANGESEGLP